jgi:hypothetical protein
MPKRKKPKSGDYEVGFGRPPKDTQFQPGHSGNQKGRPKGIRPVGAVLRDIIQRKVPVTEEGGKTRRLAVLEVMLLRLANDAMRSDQKAIKLILSLAERYAESPGTNTQFDGLLAEDQEILAQYLKETQEEPPKETPTAKGEDDDQESS